MLDPSREICQLFQSNLMQISRLKKNVKAARKSLHCSHLYTCAAGILSSDSSENENDLISQIQSSTKYSI